MKTLAALTVTAFLALGACTADGGDTAADPAPTDSAPTARDTASPDPTGAPTGPPYPGFAPTDYTYTLVVSCFCAAANAPITVTVTGDVVVDAVYAERAGRGPAVGSQAEPFSRLTIDDIVDAANDPSAASVEVTWPSGQDHPTSVSIDQDLQTIDEEVAYEISDVRVT